MFKVQSILECTIQRISLKNIFNMSPNATSFKIFIDFDVEDKNLEMSQEMDCIYFLKIS